MLFLDSFIYLKNFIKIGDTMPKRNKILFWFAIILSIIGIIALAALALRALGAI